MKPIFASGRWAVRIISAVLCVFGLSALAAGAPDATAEAAIQKRIAAQMSALHQEKASRTPAQRKMDSQLVLTARQRQGNMPVELGALRAPLDAAADNRVLVDIKATVTPELLAQIAAVGGTVVNSFPQYNAIRAWLPVDQVEPLAGLDGVTFIRKAVKYRRNIGSVTSEGDVTHRADVARNTWTIDGTGVKIGLLSDGVAHLAQSQATGDLGTVTVLPGQAGTGDEGTAMLEIVHDLAPGAELFFAGAQSSSASMAQNIRDLRAAGCDIIVDDITYDDESPFQDGIIAQAVNDVCADGALFFSSAGNAGNKTSGTAATWEGDFVDGGNGDVFAPNIRLHDFGGVLYTATQAAPKVLELNLFWSDPLGGSGNDYDLIVTDASGTILGAAQDVQNGTQDPYEHLEIPNAPVNCRIYIISNNASPRYLHLSANDVPLSVSTPGNTRGHNAAVAANAFCVAAAPAHLAQGVGDPTGPYPNPFSATSAFENFTSDGPRRMFYKADGTPYTPGNLLSTGGQLFQKPDITAADGVVTSMSAAVTGGEDFAIFYGTSAAAPHAGAVAALIKSAQPGLTPAEIRSVMTGTAFDIGAAGWDRDAGYGIVMAYEAIAYVRNSTTTTTSTTTSTTTTSTTTTSTTTTTVLIPSTTTTASTSTTIVSSTTTTTTLPDTEPPVVLGQSPAPDAWNAQCDTLIQIHVADARSGVNASTVLIEASLDQLLWDTVSDGSTSYDASGNVTFKGKTTRAGTPADYTYIYQASTSFDYEQKLYFRVNASDLAGRPMAEVTYSFTTETRSFGPSVCLDAAATGDGFAATARDSSGNIWVAWQRVGADNVGRIFVARKPKNATAFEAEMEVLPGANDRRRPALAASPAGKMWIAWETVDLNIVEVASADIADPATWTQTSAVPAPTGYTQLRHPAIAVDSTGGTVYLAFETSNGGSAEIGAVSLASGGTSWAPLPEVPDGILSNEAGSKADPVVAVGYPDMLHVVWANSTDGCIYACQHRPGSATLFGRGKVVNSSAASKPAILAESYSYSVYVVWLQGGGTPNPDVMYAHSTDPSIGLLTGTSVTHNDGGVQLAGTPKVIINYDIAPVKVLVFWHDKRSSVANDTDIMFAETRFDGTFGTNLRVAADATNSPQTDPAIGLSPYGEPYAVWTDQRGGASRIYFAQSTEAVAYAAPWTSVGSAGGSHTFTNPASSLATSIDMAIPAGVFDPPRDVSVTTLLNPDVPCPGGVGLYFDFSGGVDQVLSDWVTVTLHGVTGVPTPLVVYRYVPPTLPIAAGTWTHDYIRNESYDPATQTLTFQTKHLSSFGAGTSSTSSGGSTGSTSSSGSGGGCGMSSGSSWSMLLLPLGGLAFALTLRLRRRSPR